jgi:hypothetical protein
MNFWVAPLKASMLLPQKILRTASGYPIWNTWPSAILLKNKPVYLCITGEYRRLTEQACLENWTVSVVVQQLNFTFKMS